MRRLWIRLTVAFVLLILGVPRLVQAQVIYLQRAVLAVGDLLVADTTSSLGRLAGVAAGQVLTSGGVGAAPAYSATLPGALASPEKNDGTVFLNATEFCSTDNANLVKVRVALNDWGLRRTAAGAETFNVRCNLTSWLQRTTAGKGIRIDSIALSYQITVQPLTSHTWGAVSSVTYANNTANVVSADLATPPVLNTAVQANPYLQAVTIAAPAYLPAAANIALNVEWQAVLQNGGVYTVYGVQVTFRRTDL